MCVCVCALQLHSLGRVHGRLKAAHMKLSQEAEQRESQLATVSVVKEKVLQAKETAEQVHSVQEARLQATIAQQSKLINFLQSASPPRSKMKLKSVSCF